MACKRPHTSEQETRVVPIPIVKTRKLITIMQSYIPYIPILEKLNEKSQSVIFVIPLLVLV